MNKTANKRRKVQMPAGIRNKLMAAISMLLVSTVMMVSSTYAWFTLSTAPEVTGITTNVGANGNLEMMLLTGSLGVDGVTKAGSYYSEADDLGVISQVGDSMATSGQTVTEANETWGNLVDLSDGSYGLSNMVLSPGRLNLTNVTTETVDGVTKITEVLVGGNILKAPSYGSDGRVIDVNTVTYTGNYNSESNLFKYDDAYRGVRVIGTTTDVSARLAAYRAAKGAVTTNVNAAKNAATSSLASNGQDLANILMAYVADANTIFHYKDLRVLLRVLTALDTATDSTETAIKSAVIASSLSANNQEELTDDDVAALQTAVNAVVITDTGVAGKTCFDDIPNVVIPANIETAIKTYTVLRQNITDATNAVNGTDGLAHGLTLDNKEAMPDDEGEYKYTEDTANDIKGISGSLNYIIDKSYVKIGGVQNPGKDNLGDIMTDYVKNNCIIIDMLDGSGVYAQIANLVGNYTASGFSVEVQHEMLGDDPVPVPVTMNTLVTHDEQILEITYGSAPTDTAQAANSTLSDTYGYAIDFGFRTNAASSNLQLQTAAVNRVYSSDTTEDATLRTQGSGSYMQFLSMNPASFDADDVLALMSAIRVAFVAPEGDFNYELLAIGALDVTATPKTDATTGLVTTTYSTATGTLLDSTGAEYDSTTTDAVAAGYKIGLYLYNYKVEESVDEDKVITLTTMLEDKSAITALTQNKASKITAIVYLDGDIVDNTMVANAAESMSGVLNLQFSSSATLTPMENTGMRAGGATGVAVTYTQKYVANDSYTINGTVGTVKDGYVIYEGSDGNFYFSNNGVSYTRLTVANASKALDIEFPEEETTEQSQENTTEPSTESTTEPSTESSTETTPSTSTEGA